MRSTATQVLGKMTGCNLHSWVHLREALPSFLFQLLSDVPWHIYMNMECYFLSVLTACASSF